MSHVTFETAKRLEAAGFPQPERRRFEFWYTKDGYITPLAIDLKDGVAPMWCYFAPTATDILKELGAKFAILYDNTLEQFRTIRHTDTLSWQPRVVRGWENPAECAAMAWLQIHEKK